MKSAKWFAAAVVTATAVFLGVGVFTAGQQRSDAASSVVLLEEKWNEAYKKADIETMNALLSDDFIITVEDGATYSKTGYIAHLRDSAEHVAVAQISDAKVRLHGNTAVVTGAYREEGTEKGKPYEYRDRFTDIWLKSDGKWQLIASHYSIPAK